MLNIWKTTEQKKMKQQNDSYVFASIRGPKYKGFLCIGGKYGLQIALKEKPNIIHLFFLKLFLGIIWISK